MRFTLRPLLSLILVFCFSSLAAQSNTYILNGNATQNTCNCYTLTQAVNNQGGSVWNANKIDLSQPFDYWFNVFLGCTDGNGADGIVFILQPLSTSLGSVGGGMGFEGIVPSIGIALDTWQNTINNDPVFDHISIQKNGNLTHNADLAGPVMAKSTNANIEDCQWHTLRIKWDPATDSLSTWFDNEYRLGAKVDLIGTVFNNDPLVYWGFSGATGGANNLQQFCTALNPQFSSNGSANSACINQPITFDDESESFGPISAYYWDFGNGNTSTSSTPPPQTYPVAGPYEVKLVITGLDGCISDTLRKQIHIGAFPQAAFSISDTCESKPPRIMDQSTSYYGAISSWQWSVDGNPASNAQIPSLTNIPPGSHQMELIVETIYGCESSPVALPFDILPRPQIATVVEDGCTGQPVNFMGTQTDLQTQISEWQWTFADGSSNDLQSFIKTFNTKGDHTYSVFAVATNGCTSEILNESVFVNLADASAGNDTMAIKNEPITLQGSGGVSYLWTPSTGLDDPTKQNPVAILEEDQKYILYVVTTEGCEDTAHVNVEVFKGSAIYVPSGFTPNNDGKNDSLKPLYVGIKTIKQFSVYNRWGAQVFTTSDKYASWDGKINGGSQGTGVFVWVIQAIDFAGKTYELKGTTTIIR